MRSELLVHLGVDALVQVAHDCVHTKAGRSSAGPVSTATIGQVASWRRGRSACLIDPLVEVLGVGAADWVAQREEQPHLGHVLEDIRGAREAVEVAGRRLARHLKVARRDVGELVEVVRRYLWGDQKDVEKAVEGLEGMVRQ